MNSSSIVVRASRLLLLYLSFALSAPAAEVRLQQATKLEQQKPTPEHTLGLMEMRRAAGESLNYAQLSDKIRPTKENIELLELLGWRSLPVPQAEQRNFLRIVDVLEKADTKNAWAAVYRLYMVSQGNDRTALIGQANKIIDAPSAFPSAAAERRHLDLLRELGLDDNQAALDVITHRSFAPLHALLDLDRVLTREIDFLIGTSKSADAKVLSACRDKLRQAWLDCSRHLVERLFALHVLGRKQECDALLFAARDLPWLTDAAELSKVLAKMDQKDAWQTVIAPLLESEVALITSPPKIPATMPTTVAEFSIEARRKTISEGIATYEGAVRVKAKGLSIACDKLALIGADPASPRMLSGAGNITITGAPGFPESIQADHFTFSFDTGAFSLGGNVRLKRGDTVLKLKAATLNRTGELRDQISLLDDFDKAPDIKSKLALLPKLSAVYTDNELPVEARYLLAMSLLRPHLLWREPFDETPEERLAPLKEMSLEPVDSRWREAHSGEPWMREDAIRQLQASRRDALKNDKVETLLARELPRDFFWTIDDTKHADIALARKLLENITAGDLAETARHWSQEISRNNAVITIDLAGAFPANKSAKAVVDVRSSDRITLSIYRVRDPQTLLAAASQIGDDYIFRDYGFENQQRIHEMVKQVQRSRDITKRSRPAPPKLGDADLIKKWELNVADLKPLEAWRTERTHWDDWDGDDDDDAGYFNDRCEHFRERIEKTYVRGGRTTWRANRVIDIPADLINQSGAYILVAQAGDCRAVAPLLVDPLSLTLRRCRDGVFVSVSTTDGTKPVASATILAENVQATTDSNGVAFARVFASGDRPILAAADGRFAIGGFGDVFEGLYRRADDHGHWMRARMLHDRVLHAQEQLAHVYEDCHVVAAYTDRPTYRPGQEVHFKLIARELVPGASQPTGGFRDEDFNRRANLKLLPEGTRFTWSVHSSRGREVASGTGTLNDFATAADSFKLPDTAEVGACSLRVNFANMDRIVPDLFTVKYYRRPNFNFDLTGIPEKLEKPAPIAFKLHGEYYFGKPLDNGQFQVHLTSPGRLDPIASQSGTLSASGDASPELNPPADLPSGPYRILTTVTDSSGLSLTQSSNIQIGTPATPSLEIPLFIRSDVPLNLNTTTPLQIIHQQDERKTSVSHPARNGKHEHRFTTTGWHRLVVGDARASVFVYDDTTNPFASDSSDQNTRFVNLTDYSEEGDGGDSRYEPAHQQVHALFTTHQAKVGDKVSLLIYSPIKRPRLLFTFEGRTIADYLIVDTTSDAHYHVVDLPIRARHLPNIYLQARVIGPANAMIDQAPRYLHRLREQLKLQDDESQDPRWCRIDVSDPAETAAGAKLRIELKPKRTDYRPGDTVHVTGRVTDSTGQPRQAELSLAAVDESVFSFGETDTSRLFAQFTDPHPPRRFLPKATRSSIGEPALRLRLMRQMDQLKQAAQQLAQAMDQASQAKELSDQFERPAPLPALGHMPINQLPLAAVRSDFRETAAWLPQLRTDGSGTLAASFKLPDSLTAYRLTAIGLTRQTELGLGTARLRAALPISVQLILPRFAVEKDHFALVALLHNNTDAPRDAAITLDFKNITAQPTTPWKITGNTATAIITIAAKSSSTISLDVLCDKPALATFTLRGASQDHADAEQRTLRIVPLGRAAEISFNGAFESGHALTLPDGFVPSELHISLSRGQVAQSLDGLQYLIDYPYGCAEQTMSRFLPAVVVKAAARDLPLDLPADVTAKLPEVIKRGLDRLYSFQNPDGGWGWFANNRSEDRMSIYVLEGLARCRLAGVTVDDAVIERGATFVSNRLDQLTDPEKASAFQALALTGRIDKPKLGAFASSLAAKSVPAELRCKTALACRAAGLSKEAQSLWWPLRNWKAQTASELAQKLTAQLAFGEPIKEANLTAAQLCNLRQGHRWDSTQTTATAITALAQVLQYATAESPAKLVRINIAGKLAYSANEADLTKAVFRARLTGDQLPAINSLPLSFETDPTPAMLYTVTGTGYQRLDNFQPTGDKIRVTRRYTTLEGKPLTVAKPSQVIAVTLTLHLDKPQEYLIIEDPRPSLFEYAGEDITGPAAGSLSNKEFRDDRAALFFTRLTAGDHTLTYYLQAQTTGQCHTLPAAAYPMYNEKEKGESGTTKLDVRP